MMNTTEAQALVSAAVEARGYRDGWNAEQFAARQVAKMVEELGEIARHFDNTGSDPYASMEWIVESEQSRRMFDSEDAWVGVELHGPMHAYKELCDVVVVALTMAGALSEIIGKPLDVVADAVAKATADVKRGTR